MNELNPEHYKYMPQSSEIPKPEEETPVVGEEKPNEQLPSYEPLVSAEEHAENMEKWEEEIKEGTEEEGLEETADTLRPLAKIINALLSPFFAPAIATWWIFSFSLLRMVAPGATAPYTLTVFGATGLVPFVVYYILLKSGVVKTVEMSTCRERIAMYIVEILALGAVTIFFILRGANPWIWTIFCGGTAVAVVNFILNFFMRVSCHCSAMSSLLAVLIIINKSGMPQVNLFWWLIGTIAALGFVGWMAIKYGRHTVWEVLAGYATGFLGIILFSLIR